MKLSDIKYVHIIYFPKFIHYFLLLFSYTCLTFFPIALPCPVPSLLESVSPHILCPWDYIFILYKIKNKYTHCIYFEIYIKTMTFYVFIFNLSLFSKKFLFIFNMYIIKYLIEKVFSSSELIIFSTFQHNITSQCGINWRKWERNYWLYTM